MLVAVLLDQDQRDVLEVLANVDIKKLRHGSDFFRVFELPWLLLANEAREHQRSRSNKRRWDSDKITVEEGVFHEESSDALGSCLFTLLHAQCSQPCFWCWVSKLPAQSLENVALHLDKSGFVVCTAAHGNEVLDRWHTVLCIFVLCRNEQGCRADELVVSLEGDALRHVSVDDVHRQV